MKILQLNKDQEEKLKSLNFKQQLNVICKHIFEPNINYNIHTQGKN